MSILPRRRSYWPSLAVQPAAQPILQSVPQQPAPMTLAPAPTAPSPAASMTPAAPAAPAAPSITSIAQLGGQNLNYTPEVGTPQLNRAWTAYDTARQGRTVPFGSMAAGGMSYPTRETAPESQAIRTDGELDYMIGNWRDTLAQRMDVLNDTDVNGIAAQRAFNGFVSDYDSGQGAPFQPLQQVGAWQSAAAGDGTFAADGQTYNLSQYIDPQRQAVKDGLSSARSNIGASVTAAKAGHEALLANRAVNQTTQQQAYNGMSGNGLLNGVLTEAYSMPGFGQVTGSAPSTPTMGSLSAGSGVFDPSTQSGVFGQSRQRSAWSL